MIAWEYGAQDPSEAAFGRQTPYIYVESVFGGSLKLCLHSYHVFIRCLLRVTG